MKASDSKKVLSKLCSLLSLIFLLNSVLVNAGLFDIFSYSLFSPPDVSHSKALEVIQRTSCWHRPQVKEIIEDFCLQPTLSDEGRYRLAIALTNCHLSASGLDEIVCDKDDHVLKCTKAIPDKKFAFETYTTFYAHIDSLCFYMKKDNFHQSTTDAINALAFATVQSKESLVEFAQDMERNQQKLADHFEAHAEDEDRRFERLIGSLSNAQTLLQYIGVGQKELSEKSDEIRDRTGQIHSKQFETLQQLGLVSLQLTEFEKEERIRFETTLGRMIIVEEQLKQQTETFNQTYSNLTTQVLDTHTHLNSLSSQLATDLAQTRNQLSALIHDVFYAIQNLHIELISFTSLFFYPATFLLIFFLTSSSRAYNSRMSLYSLLAAVFLFERSLAKGAGWALYLAHGIMCSMRYSHSFILSTALRVVRFSFSSAQHLRTHSPPLEEAISSASLGSVLLATKSNTSNPSEILHTCPSCIITVHTIVSTIMSIFPSSADDDDWIQWKKGLGEILPTTALTTDQYVSMIEVIRICFLFISASIWSWTIVTYRDPIKQVGQGVDEVMVKLTLLERSMESFKCKMMVWSQALNSTSRASLSSFSQRFSHLLGTQQISQVDPDDCMEDRSLNSPNRQKSRFPLEGSETISSENALTTPKVSRSKARTSRKRDDTALFDELERTVDPDGDVVYIPSPGKHNQPAQASSASSKPRKTKEKVVLEDDEKESPENQPKKTSRGKSKTAAVLLQEPTPTPTPTTRRSRAQVAVPTPDDSFEAEPEQAPSRRRSTRRTALTG